MADQVLWCRRGVNGLHIVLLLFAYKLRYPDQCVSSAQQRVCNQQAMVLLCRHWCSWVAGSELSAGGKCSLQTMLQRVPDPRQPRVWAGDAALRLLRGVRDESQRADMAARL